MLEWIDQLSSADTTNSAYVPYSFWVEADPRIECIIQNVLLDFRHELLKNNFQGIPVLQQHGGSDDNVPTFHGRRMHSLIQDGNISQENSYYEVPGEGHWYEGIMTTQQLRKFYTHYLERDTAIPELPRAFQIVVANPRTMGSRGGLLVDQLVTPDHAGIIEVADNTNEILRIETSNIRRFHFLKPSALIRTGSRIVIDGQTSQTWTKTLTALGDERQAWFLRVNEQWQVRGSIAQKDFANALMVAHTRRELALLGTS